MKLTITLDITPEEVISIIKSQDERFPVPPPIPSSKPKPPPDNNWAGKFVDCIDEEWGKEQKFTATKNILVHSDLGDKIKFHYYVSMPSWDKKHFRLSEN